MTTRIVQRMTMLISTSREAAGTTRNAWNVLETTTTTPLVAVRGYWQGQMARVASEDKLIQFASHYIWLELNRDIQEGDRVTAITNAQGDAVFDKDLRVVGVVQRENHLECACEEYS